MPRRPCLATPFRLVRRLAPSVVALWMLIAQPALAAATAGWESDARCCCPSPETCHCPGGDPGHSGDPARMKSCSNAGHIGVSAPQVRLLAPSVEPITMSRTNVELVFVLPRPLDSRAVHPITPPS